MVIDGRWTDGEHLRQDGHYVRQKSVFANRIDERTLAALRDEPQRFVLVASYSCQWSHRALVARALKGLAPALQVQMAHGPLIEGYAVNGGRRWRIPGSDREIIHLHELYTKGDPNYSGRSTVPVLWDSARQKVVSNESSAIFEALDRIADPADATAFVLEPASVSAGNDRVHALVTEMEQLKTKIYDGLANGVYRAGFAESQPAYDEAVVDVFATLDVLEERLSRRRYLMGSVLTSVDWYLFPTLVRFDAVYHILHRCCLRRLIDYPHLWAYARDLYSWQGIAETVDFDQIRSASYGNDTMVNPHGIVAIAPDADWRAPHGRDRFGPAQVLLGNGTRMSVDPATFNTPSGD